VAGPQRGLFPSLQYRNWDCYTRQQGDPVDVDVTMAAHAHVAQDIARLEVSGRTRFPFSRFKGNATWLMTMRIATDLVRWLQMLRLAGHW